MRVTKARKRFFLKRVCKIGLGCHEWNRFCPLFLQQLLYNNFNKTTVVFKIVFKVKNKPHTSFYLSKKRTRLRAGSLMPIISLKVESRQQTCLCFRQGHGS
ncbi:hypothetical protein EV207_1492 [Scopulibacillus darangshiensis]|uniref:Uncharacterized protein n=1 Tax=Scopulibacillus darangshiensis TaxID=442528 RepID=A0A4R2NHW4_9BACL|nr:hypothetical protein EV207_1492 [Scopulibacillus darangshiensis]